MPSFDFEKLDIPFPPYKGPSEPTAILAAAEIINNQADDNELEAARAEAARAEEARTAGRILDIQIEKPVDSFEARVDAAEREAINLLNNMGEAARAKVDLPPINEADANNQSRTKQDIASAVNLGVEEIRSRIEEAKKRLADAKASGRPLQSALLNEDLQELKAAESKAIEDDRSAGRILNIEKQVVTDFTPNFEKADSFDQINELAKSLPNSEESNKILSAINDVQKAFAESSGRMDSPLMQASLNQLTRTGGLRQKVADILKSQKVDIPGQEPVQAPAPLAQEVPPVQQEEKLEEPVTAEPLPEEDSSIITQPVEPIKMPEDSAKPESSTSAPKPESNQEDRFKTMEQRIAELLKRNQELEQELRAKKSEPKTEQTTQSHETAEAGQRGPAEKAAREFTEKEMRKAEKSSLEPIPFASERHGIMGWWHKFIAKKAEELNNKYTAKIERAERYLEGKSRTSFGILLEPFRPTRWFTLNILRVQQQWVAGKLEYHQLEHRRHIQARASIFENVASAYDLPIKSYEQRRAALEKRVEEVDVQLRALSELEIQLESKYRGSGAEDIRILEQVKQIRDKRNDLIEERANISKAIGREIKDSSKFINTRNRYLDTYERAMSEIASEPKKRGRGRPKNSSTFPQAA